MKHLFYQKAFRTISPLAIMTVLYGASSIVSAQTIISDTFTAPDFTFLTVPPGTSTHSPDVNLTGNAWTQNGSFWSDAIIFQGALQLNTDRGAGISLQGYALPSTSLTISADLNPNNLGASGAARGVMLGFFTPTAIGSETHGYNGFLGFLLDPGTGNLSLMNNDATGNSPNIISSQAYTLGTWTEAAVHTLSYTINTTTGGITGASLTDANGTENYTFSTSLFTASSLDWLGVAVSSSAGSTTAIVDNLSLVANPVPEPGTWTLAISGLGMLFLWRKRLTKI